MTQNREKETSGTSSIYGGEEVRLPKREGGTANPEEIISEGKRELPKLPLPPPTKQLEKPKEPEKAPKYPPLFIKVDKYNDVIKSIQELRSYVLNLRDALDVLEDIQKEIETGIHISQKALDELNMILSSLDSYLMRPQGIGEEHEETHTKVTQPTDIEGYVKDVYGQLKRIKDQLNTIS